MTGTYIITKLMDYQHKLDEAKIRLNAAMMYSDVKAHTVNNGENPLDKLERIIDDIVNSK